MGATGISEFVQVYVGLEEHSNTETPTRLGKRKASISRSIYFYNYLSFIWPNDFLLNLFIYKNLSLIRQSISLIGSLRVVKLLFHLI